MKTTTSLLALATVAIFATASCTAVIDPDGTMDGPSATATTTTTTTTDNPYLLGDRTTTTEKTTVTYD